MTFELQLWIPLFNLFSVVSPITFLLWSAAGKKNNTFALVIVAEDLLLAYHLNVLQNLCIGTYSPLK